MFETSHVLANVATRPNDKGMLAMTKLQTRCLFFILLVPLFGNGCGQPSTEDNVKAIGGMLPRHHMSFGPTSPTTALFYGPTITDEKLAGIDLESLPTVINVTLMETVIARGFSA